MFKMLASKINVPNVISEEYRIIIQNVLFVLWCVRYLHSLINFHQVVIVNSFRYAHSNGVNILRFCAVSVY
jgi:hypothetical protein